MNILEPDFLFRFIIQIVALVLLLKFTFFRYSKDRDALFSFTLFGHGVFIVAKLLHNVDISMGFAFGLFAIFSMLRYRTESISVRNMTYLFLVIVVSLISSVAPVSLPELIMLNTTLCALAWICETRVLATRHEVSTLTYGCMPNLKPQARGVLIADLTELTGLDVQSVEIIDRNYKNKTAKLRIFHHKPELSTNLQNVMNKAPERTSGKRIKDESSVRSIGLAFSKADHR